MADGRGLPLLSGPPPQNENGRAETACRKCNKEFNIIFTRSRRCNHCGYAYCHNCTDYQALMPRTEADSSGSGYDAMNVCAFCIEFLQITAAGKGHLRSLPLAKLKKYASSYSIKIDHALEKDDVIEALIAARNPNGCLPLRNENYYRAHSVPDRTSGSRPRGLFSRGPAAGSTPAPPPPPPPPRQSTRPEFARPDLAPDNPPPLNTNSRPQPTRMQPSAPRPAPRPQSQPYHQQNPSYQQYNSAPNFHHPYNMHHADNGHRANPPPPPRTPRPQGAPSTGPYQRQAPSRSSHNLNTPPPWTPPRPRAASAAPPPAPTPPPTLEELLQLAPENISSMSIGMLKAILFTNHVNAGMILEKGELVQKVNVLIEDEKRERERIRIAEEREDQERIRRQREMMEERERASREREEARRREEEAERMSTETPPSTPPDSEESAPSEGATQARSTSTPPPTSTPHPSTSYSDRSGLCVVCQDEEANIAIVDCGHLAMCRTCCDAIMHSTRECPLCRTRIVTEARLLRIFKA